VDTPHPRLLYGHRGASAERPENTIVALQRALDVGANALEIDVHVTRDGRVVVAHDATGTRMANEDRRIHACTWDEVRRWDAGWGFVDHTGNRPFAEQGLHPPLLDEVLETFPDVPLNVDLKEGHEPLLVAFLNLIRRSNAEHRVRAACFRSRPLRRLERLGWKGPLGLSQEDVLRLLTLPKRWALRRTAGDQAAQLPLRAGPIRFDRPKFMSRCRQLGLRLDYWVVNDIATAQRLWTQGANGIVSDDPGLIVSTLP
jgi:glycerophosphoryl diester phosphodiesterase